MALGRHSPEVLLVDEFQALPLVIEAEESYQGRYSKGRKNTHDIVSQKECTSGGCGGIIKKPKI
jgi:hypothetical protein